MNLRDSILRFYVALACLSCVRDQPATDKDAGAPTVIPPPPPPAQTAEAAAPAPTVAPWAAAYDDKQDAPANLGDARCPAAPPANAKPASVKVELFASPPAIELSVPSLGVKQRIWPGSANASECHASIIDDGKALRFHCSEETSSVDGKLYFRKSDIQLGRATPTGSATTKFVLPCETPPKLEPLACPTACKKTDAQTCTCGTFKK